MGFVDYLANNVPLFCICAVVLFLAIRNIKTRKKESIYFIVFTIIVLFLSGIAFLEKYGQYYGYVILATIATSLGYIIRPILLYIFVLLSMTDLKVKRKTYLLLAAPLILVSIIYIFPFFFNNKDLSTFVFYYQLLPSGKAEFVRGGFLNFTSHIICLVYLGYLIYLSIVRFHGKHRKDGLVIILCVIIIILTVVTEMLTGRNDLLNIVCEICAVVNYIFLHSVNASKDPLTNIYDRRTYYEDISKYKNNVNGIVQIDMNGLKYLNDNFGHLAGDEALSQIANIFENSIDKHTMCVYRLSGDEFLILMFDGQKESLEKTVNIIKEKIKEANYSIAIGYLYYDKNTVVTYEQALKKAEQLMYENKDNYYKISGIDRRKV